MLARSTIRRCIRAPAASARTTTHRRQLAALAERFSPLFVARKGEQVPVASHARKTISKTSHGVVIATYDDLGPASTLAVVLGGGSRHDDAHHPGLAHIVKASLIRNLPNDNIVRTIRETELRGDTLSTELTRENIIIKSEFLRDDLVDAAPLLINSVFNQHFYPYEFLDAIPRVVAESRASLADPTISVLEALHRVAFRTGLGNPLFASEESLHGLTRAHIAKFVSTHFKPERTAIVGVGICHADLVEMVQGLLSKVKFGDASASESTSTSKYHGGEVQTDGGPHAEAHVAVAFPGVPFTSPDYPASLVLRALLDSTPRISYSHASEGALASASTPLTSLAGLHASYSDAGLIGFYAKGNISEMKSVVQGAMQALGSVASNVSDAALARAKKMAVIDGQAAVETKGDQAYEVGKQVLSSIGAFHSAADLADAISKVTAQDVSKLASNALTAKPSMSSYGNTLLLPYLDDLKL
ncbi:hypothetical protein SeMB42_g07894 [Synchytrium endobioticum]|uniref:Cytochrome b-c1 complex subunit 2, mitochondrial n=1 Tax=Synchytrium endobioticum TaxID=286115 RepID=A0A507BSF5_9FUNG|nr:hypothetical protein SeMB42_g07894 [Synchytrium endobioticum]TPX36440.1 hypothetical protein SeLEV6574_g08044 [Synchytrium endobioticum]